MLTFCNQYTRQVWVAIMWYSPGCPDGGDWEKAGWWHINPAECQNIWDVDLDEINQYYYFYAESDDGAVWSGSTYVDVPYQRFDWCIGTSSSDSRSVGFQLFDVDSNDDFTMTLLP